MPPSSVNSLAAMMSSSPLVARYQEPGRTPAGLSFPQSSRATAIISPRTEARSRKCARGDLNADHQLRRLVSYPLDDGRLRPVPADFATY